MKVSAVIAILATLAIAQAQSPQQAPPVTLATANGPSVPVSPPAYLGSPQGTAVGPAAAGGGSGSAGAGGAGAAGITDADILTFAYNLEVFEAQFYSCIATGQPISSDLLGGGPAPSECKKGNLSESVLAYATELATEETAHVKLIFTSLKAAGASPVAPLVNIDSAFSAAAQAAFPGVNLSPAFDPYANDVFFLHAAFLFEDLGASAYIGAGSLIQDPAYRLVGSQIGNTEAYHSSLIRTLLYQKIDTTPAYGQTVGQITSAIVATLNAVAGAPQVKYGLENAQGASIANVDSNGLTPAASPKQVLSTVTLGAPAGQGGGFFPNNLNGNIKN